MAELLSFHGVSGLWPGANGLTPLEGEGHTFHSPDLFDGNRFESADAGAEYVQQIGRDTIADRGQTRNLLSTNPRRPT